MFRVGAPTKKGGGDIGKAGPEVGGRAEPGRRELLPREKAARRHGDKGKAAKGIEGKIPSFGRDWGYPVSMLELEPLCFT